MKKYPFLFLAGIQNTQLIHDALEFARAAHEGQARKYTGEPYYNHCYAVACTVSETMFNEKVIAAAALHDTLEDTKTTVEDLLARFGPEVTALVMEVTDVSTKADGNRAVRKAIDRAHLAKSSHAGATIKLADLLDNTSSIVEHDRNFAQFYLREKAALLGVLTHGEHDLWERACSQVRKAAAELGIIITSFDYRRSA